MENRIPIHLFCLKISEMKYLQFLFFMFCCELICACSNSQRVDNKIMFSVDDFKELKGEDFLPEMFWGMPVGI